MSSENAAAVNWEGPKLKETLENLAPELRQPFRELVEAVFFACAKRGWHPIRRYAVLADLIRDGWRPTA